MSNIFLKNESTISNDINSTDISISMPKEFIIKDISNNNLKKNYNSTQQTNNISKRFINNKTIQQNYNNFQQGGYNIDDLSPTSTSNQPNYKNYTLSATSSNINFVKNNSIQQNYNKYQTGRYNINDLSPTSTSIEKNSIQQNYNKYQTGGYNIDDFSPTSTSIQNNQQNYNTLSATSSNINFINNKLNHKKSINKSNEYLDDFSPTSTAINSILQNHNNISATSSNMKINHNFIKQNHETETSYGNLDYDINKLTAMLTSESSSGYDISVNQLENELSNLIQESKKYKLNNIEDYYTTTDMSTMYGGAKKNKRGINPGMEAFIKLKKYVAEQLNISNGPKAAKIAGIVQRDVKEKFSDLTDSSKILEKAKNHLDKNINHYKQLLN